jgi:predicted ArsR family transcriptional regulator
MKTSSQILFLLQKRGSLTVLELSQSLGLTKAAVRYQLNQLLRHDLISINNASAPTAAGRPAARYSVIVLPNQSLTRRLLEVFTGDVMKCMPTGTEIEQVAETIASALLSSGEIKNVSKSARISLQLANLSQQGFQVHWEVRQEGPLVIIESEPLSAVLPNETLVAAVLEAIRRGIG